MADVAVQPVIVLVKVNTDVPSDIPVATPALVTVAINWSLLVQVPPVVGNMFMVPFMATEAGAETIGSVFTVATTAVLAGVVQPAVGAST